MSKIERLEELVEILRGLLRERYSREELNEMVKSEGYCLDCYHEYDDCVCESSSEDEGDEDDEETKLLPSPT